MRKNRKEKKEKNRNELRKRILIRLTTDMNEIYHERNETNNKIILLSRGVFITDWHSAFCSFELSICLQCVIL